MTKKLNKYAPGEDWTCRHCGAGDGEEHEPTCREHPDAKLAHASGRATTNPIHAMLDERGSRYGKFMDHARVTQAMKDIVYSEMRRRDQRVEPDQLEALDMIVHKIGRIVCGDPDYEDSWRDIVGYATLVADRLKGEER